MIFEKEKSNILDSKSFIVEKLVSIIDLSHKYQRKFLKVNIYVKILYEKYCKFEMK